MAHFLDGRARVRGAKRKKRPCLVCENYTDNAVVCALHPEESAYCAECIAGMWTTCGRMTPQCTTCGKSMDDSLVRKALTLQDREDGTDHVRRFDQHEQFLHGDSELPLEGWKHRVCACHTPACKGAVSSNLKWIVFRSTFKAPRVVWTPESARFERVTGASARHPPVCAHCLMPGPGTHTSLAAECVHCVKENNQSKLFSSLRHYIDPLAGAHGQWRMPKRSHELSWHALRAHLFWILEDVDLFVRCPVDGTVLGHGADCHELTCPTCKLTRACFVCGRTELTGVDGAILDHFGPGPRQCQRYPKSHAWLMNGTEYLYPCTDACDSLDSPCAISDHKVWRDLYQMWRRTRWVEEFVLELPNWVARGLVEVLKTHEGYKKNCFQYTWTVLEQLVTTLV